MVSHVDSRAVLPGFRNKTVRSRRFADRMKRYEDGLLALIFRPELLAAQDEKRRIAEQVASDGGYEVKP